jgi:hypothetical protein
MIGRRILRALLGLIHRRPSAPVPRWSTWNSTPHRSLDRGEEIKPGRPRPRWLRR